MYSFVIYGKPGVGKTTLAAKKSKSVLFDFERGSKFVEHPLKISVSSLQAFREKLHPIVNDKDRPETIIIDSITAVEKMIQREILAESGAKNLATALGGYGNAYKEAVSRFAKLHEFLDGHFHIVLYIGHVSQTLTPNPFGADYEQYTLQLDSRLREYVFTQVDGVYYYTYDYSVIDDKVRTSQKRIVITSANEACLCKDRLSLPIVCTGDELITKIESLN